MRYRFLRFPEGKSKAVTFSYDDGCRSDMRLAQLFSQYGLKATFNICSGLMGISEDGWHLTPDQIQKYILDPGHEVAIHGAHHRAPGKTRPVEGITDVLSCRTELENTFGCIIRGLAYPDSGIRNPENGGDYGTVRSYLQALDIAYARGLGRENDSYLLPEDWYNWLPTCHHDSPRVFDHINAFLDLDTRKQYLAVRSSRLLYIWGHSYEFQDKGNWDHMENICKVLSHQDDIWYATNMEIYRYVTDAGRLIYSADGRRIYNPTLTTIYLETDGVTRCIAPGETITA